MFLFLGTWYILNNYAIRSADDYPIVTALCFCWDIIPLAIRYYLTRTGSVAGFLVLYAILFG